MNKKRNSRKASSNFNLHVKFLRGEEMQVEQRVTFELFEN
jgi:hypothetical protein